MRQPKPIQALPLAAADVAGSIEDRFEAVATAYPDRPAVIGVRGERSYRDLAERVRRVGAALAGGTAPVAILANDPFEVIVSMLGTLRAGRIYVPLDPIHSPQRLRAILRHSGADLLLTDHLATAEVVAGSEHPVTLVDDAVDQGDDSTPLLPVSPDSHSSLLYTSGSTGQPKGVVQSHRNVLFHVRHLTHTFQITPTDRHSLVASFGFDASTTDIFCTLLNGAALVPIDVRRDGLAHLGSRLREHSVSLYHSTPTVFRHMIAPPGGLPDLRLVLLGGEPVTAQDLRLFDHLCPPDALFANGYGATETAGFTALSITSRDAVSARAGAQPVGTPVAGVELVLRDKDGRDADEGELVVLSDHLGVGYWRDSEATDASFSSERRGERTVNAYRTGDHARREADGQIVLLGRRDGLVKVHGHRVSLSEVESALSSLPSVRHAVVVLHDGDLVAYVCRTDRTRGLKAELGLVLPDFMIPQWILDLDALPLTSNGKVDVAALPKPGAHNVGTATGPPTRPAASTTERKLAKIWQDVLGVDSVGRDVNFYDVGGSSLLFARVHAAVEERFGVGVPARRLFEHPTVRAFARFLDDLRGVDDASKRRVADHADQRAAARLTARRRRSGQS